MLKLIYIFGNVLTVNSCCCVKKLVSLCTFLNSTGLFQNVFDKRSKVLNLVYFFKKGIFPEHRHILGYIPS